MGERECGTGEGLRAGSGWGQVWWGHRGKRERGVWLLRAVCVGVVCGGLRGSGSRWDEVASRDWLG